MKTASMCVLAMARTALIMLESALVYLYLMLRSSHFFCVLIFV